MNCYILEKCFSEQLNSQPKSVVSVKRINRRRYPECFENFDDKYSRKYSRDKKDHKCCELRCTLQVLMNWCEIVDESWTLESMLNNSYESSVD